MISHIFKLMWNRKKRNFLLIVEIFFSFMVLFGLFTIVVEKVDNYFTPAGFNPENVWAVQVNRKVYMEEGSREKYLQIKQLLKTMPQIEKAGFMASNYPFNNSRSTTGFSDTTGVEYNYDVVRVEKEIFDVLGMEIERGKMFDETLSGEGRSELVVNRKFLEQLGDRDPIDLKLIDAPNPEYDDPGRDVFIRGVTPYYRYRNSFYEDLPTAFEPINLQDTAQRVWFSSLLLRVKPGTDASFEESLLTKLEQLTPGWTYSVSWLTDQRAVQDREELVPIIILSIVAIFLVLNVVLGLYGVLWYNINRRVSEIGLRRSMGATAQGIQLQFVGETVVIAIFSLILGLFFAVQFPLLEVFQIELHIYIKAMLFSLVLIGGIAIFCALYPARLAATIEPAHALHQD